MSTTHSEEESSFRAGLKTNRVETCTEEGGGDVTPAADVARERKSNAAQTVTEEPAATPFSQEKQKPSSKRARPFLPPQHPLGPLTIRGPPITTTVIPPPVTASLLSSPPSLPSHFTLAPPLPLTHILPSVAMVTTTQGIESEASPLLELTVEETDPNTKPPDKPAVEDLRQNVPPEKTNSNVQRPEKPAVKEPLTSVCPETVNPSMKLSEKPSVEEFLKDVPPKKANANVQPSKKPPAEELLKDVPPEKTNPSIKPPGKPAVEEPLKDYVPPEELDQPCKSDHMNGIQSVVKPCLGEAERPSLEDLLKGVPPDQLDQPCRDADLCEIALSVTKWKSIAPFLGLTKAEEENIEKDCGENETQKIGMLRKWREKFGRKATYRKLTKVFFKLERIDLVEEMCEVLQTENDTSYISDLSSSAIRKDEKSHEVVNFNKAGAVTREVMVNKTEVMKSSLEDLLKNVPPEKLNQPCSDSHLSEIALSLTDWQSVAPFLGLSECEEKELGYFNTKDPAMQTVTMLQMWKKKFAHKATYRTLINVLWKRDKISLVLLVSTMLANEDTTDFFTTYAEYLKGRYKTELPAFFILQWPPPPTHKVFNLAMIGHDTIQRGPVDEKFVQLTVTGNVDGILEAKAPVDLKNIFSLDKKARKVIVIEGAPGAGKSTLAWYICQKWESGELFQEYNIVVFVQLRDPDVQSAKSLADILPIESENMQKKIMSDLQSSWGETVLFVLDGWDEYGPGLQVDSPFQQLICKPAKVNMHRSSLIITSRPIASGELQQYASSRVEIVGFTSAEVKKYFSESIGDNETVQKLHDHLRERPVIEASCYLPLNAAIVVHLFLALNHTLPHTLHEVFLKLVLCCIKRHLTKEAEGRKEIPDITSLDCLPPDVLEPFKNICTMAYHGVMENKITFSAADLRSFNLPTTLSTLSLIQGTQSFMDLKKSLSCNFLHLSVQELLAAFHISKLTAANQVRIFNDLFDQPRLAAVFRFYAAFTQLQTEGVRIIVAKIVEKRQKSLLVNLLHGLYEAQDSSLCEFVASHLNGELDLQGMTLSPMDCLVVGYFLSCVCLTANGEFKVSFANCSLDDYRVSFLMRELTKCSSSTNAREAAIGDGVLVIDISKNSVQMNGCKAIGDALMVGSSLRMLDLYYNPISAGVVHLAESLNNNHSLLEINLGRCSITRKEVESLAVFLTKNNSLQTLILSENIFSDVGAAHIADGLRQNNCLRRLNMSHCGISDWGMSLLASSLEVNSSLEELHLSGNHATGVGLMALGKSLKRNKGLKKLWLIGVHTYVLKQFILCLQENSHLTQLYLYVYTYQVRQAEDAVNQIRREKNLPLLVIS